MGTGYVRADTGNNIANGNVIDADDLDNEFNAVEAAFNSSTGHTHDGTTSEGAPIEVIGPAQDIVATASALRPKTTNTVDLGTTVLKYKDAYLAGDLNIDGTVTSSGSVNLGSTSITGTLAVSTDTTLTGNLTANGNTTLGNADTDTVTINADIASSLIPSVDDSYDLGAVGSEWRDAYIDGTAYIDTGSIDTANVTTLNVSGNVDVDGNLTVDGSINASITGVAATADALTTARTITLAGDVTGAANFDGSSNVTITTNLVVGGTEVTASGAQLNILDGATLTTADLNTLDGILASTTELNKLNGVTATTAELNTLAGISASTTEINHLDGVTSNIQTQLDGKLTDFSLESYTGDVDIDGELVVTSYNETYIAVTSSSNASTIDCEAGNVFSHTLSENTTFTFSNQPTSGTAYGFSLKIVQDASASGYVITWPSAVIWPSADQYAASSAPRLTSTASAIDQFVFYTHDGGTTWYGFTAGLNLG
jgi:cytoskeletal protein CcmA (bactofilin family)